MIPRRTGHGGRLLFLRGRGPIRVGRRGRGRRRGLGGGHCWLWPRWRRRIRINHRIRGRDLRGGLHRGDHLGRGHREGGHVLRRRSRNPDTEWIGL